MTPDPEFAARLRSRLESRSLPAESNRRSCDEWHRHRDRGIERHPTVAESTVPRPAALPYLTVAGAREAIDWYVAALGATVVGEPIVMDDGRIGHAELALGGGVLYLADEYPEIGLRAPAPQAVSVSLMLSVADTDQALERARAKGAEVQREPYENYGSRSAAIIDPFGHRWMLSGPVTGALVPDPTRRRRLRVGVDAGRRPRRRVLRSRARVDLRCGQPSSDQRQPAHRVCSRRRSADDVLLLRGHRPGGGAAVDSRRRRPGRRSRAVRLRHRARCNGSSGARVRGLPAAARRAPPGAQRRRARRSFVHHLRGDRLVGLPGLLQPGVVLVIRAGPRRRRLADHADPPDGRRRGWQHRST